MEDSVYHRQAKLLLRILPIIERYPIFALKGGTAINFFIRDLPRLSVDIDLTYVLLDERDKALSVISGALKNITDDIERLIPNAMVSPKKHQGNLHGLIVRADSAIVKVEPNLVLRGTIYEPVVIPVTKRVEEIFAVSMDVKVLALADIYGGKVCAALDRQHPRDLFDVKLLLDNEGFTDAVRKSFVVHLISHERPMAEILHPNYQDIKEVFKNEFEGMPFIKVSLEQLETARDNLVQSIHGSLTDKERQFIISVKSGNPRWDLLGLEGIDLLPAVRWKLFNISHMDKKKLKRALNKLEKSLAM
jgi:predicted nucleotidyltransferase component of viral defense system